MAERQRNESKPAGARPKTNRSRSERGPASLMAGLTILAVLAAVFISFAPLTPVLLAIPVIPFYYRFMKNGDRRKAFILVLRWTLTVFITISVVGGFNSELTGEAVPLSDKYLSDIQNWIGMSDMPPPADYIVLLGGLAVFAVAVAATGGLGGFVVGGLGLSACAVGVAYLFQNGDNLFQVLVIAVPPWLLCFLVACLFLFVPLSVPLFKRVFGSAVSPDKMDLRRYAYIGLGLVVASLLIRLAASGLWMDLTQRWTTF